jgi:hypothetical protein
MTRHSQFVQSLSSYRKTRYSLKWRFPNSSWMVGHSEVIRRLVCQPTVRSCRHSEYSRDTAFESIERYRGPASVADLPERDFTGQS